MKLWLQITLLLISTIVFLSLITLGALLINRPSPKPVEPPIKPPIEPPTKPPIEPPTKPPPIQPPRPPPSPPRPPPSPPRPRKPPIDASPEQIRAYCEADYAHCKRDPTNYFCRSVEACIQSFTPKNKKNCIQKHKDCLVNAQGNINKALQCSKQLRNCLAQK